MDNELAPILDTQPVASPVATTAPTRLGGYLRGVGRWVGWTAPLLIPVFVVSAVFVSEIIVPNCQTGVRQTDSFFDRYVYDQGCLDRASFLMGGVSFLLILGFAVGVASAFATLRGRGPPGAPQGGTRLQGIKDWFIRGDIDESDYQRVKKLAEAADDPDGPGRIAASAATFFQAWALVLVPLLVFWFIFIAVFIDDMVWFANYEEEYAMVINWIAGGLLGIGLVVFGSVRAAQLRRYRTSYEREVAARLERAEEELMRKARSLHAGVRAPAMPTGETTSFTPYRSRRR